MPIIVIVLMFLVAFLLAVIAMILMPILGVGYALWNKGQIFGSDYVAGMQCAKLEPNSRPNDSLRRFE
jgi:multidrug transporter EmrE-like cation transporter